MRDSLPNPRLLTAKYGGLQGCYWAAYSGLFSFAAAFLMAKGYTASQTGLLLAVATLCSCLLQPNMAALADRCTRLSLQTMITCIVGASWVCLILLKTTRPAPLPFGILYLFGALLLDLSLPLINALSVYYCDRGVNVNYGVGRGVGSLAYAGASALLGYAMESYGSDVMLTISICIYLVFLLLAVTFPRLQRPAVKKENPSGGDLPVCSLWQFFRRYQWYCVSLLGILFMAAFHAMTENYLIAILGRVGGGSGDLGIALAIATVLETPVVMLYATYRARAKSSTWLIIAAASFLLKSVCLLFARSVLAIMLIQILQFCSFGLYVPTSVFYAREQVSLPDMVKGQAMITAAYALGCSMGSFLGGRLLDLGGVQSLLFSGVGLAAVALIILVLSTKKIERIQKT